MSFQNLIFLSQQVTSPTVPPAALEARYFPRSGGRVYGSARGVLVLRALCKCFPSASAGEQWGAVGSSDALSSGE